ncbi:MAG: TolC family protein [Nannocystaceae bacterium]
MNSALRRILMLVMLLSTGCAKLLGDNQPREVQRDVPASYGIDPGPSATSVAQAHWDELFTDADLSALLEAALENNQELNIQLQEIIIAKSEVGARRGEYLPRLGAGVGVGVEKVGADTSQGVSDAAHNVPENLLDLRFGLSASWEVDVWGKLRNAAKAANSRYLATIEAKNFLTTQVIAEIARSYYELIAIDQSIAVVDRYVSLTEGALETVRFKKAAARATELAVQRFEAEVSRSKARRYTLVQRRVQAENRINFLVGRFPQHVARSSELLDEQALARVTNTGLPTQLLDNRADVRRAELQLEAAKLNVKSAKAQFYPSLTLDAGVGYETFNAAHLLTTPQSLAYNVAGGLVAPLLNRKAIKAQYQTANAMQIQAVFAFEKTLLLAYTEVVNELARIENLADRYTQLTAQVETLEHAVEVSGLLYRSAHADYMEVLLTRRDALEAEQELIEAKLQRMLAMVALYRALGGGWR